MLSYGLTLALRDDPAVIDRYRDEHRHVWPGVIARLRDIGVEEMEIFLSGRRLFMYMVAREGFDPAVEFSRLEADPEYRAWDEMMRALQEPVPEARPGDWWLPMEQVFDLKWPSHSSPARDSPGVLDEQ